MRRRLRLVASVTVAMLLITTAAFAADLASEASLSSAAATPTEVEVGANPFTIDVWATGNNNANQTVTVVTKYTMSTGGVITPSADTVDRATLSFPTANYSNPKDQLGAVDNPHVVSATLVVATGTPANTEGTLTVSMTSSGGNLNLLPDGGSLAAGYVKVVSTSTPDCTTGRSVPAAPSISVSPTAADTGWYNIATGAPTFTIAPSANAEYSLDGGSTWTAYSAGVQVQTDGQHAVVARNYVAMTADCARVDGVQSVATTIKVDRTAPVVTLSSDGPQAGTSYDFGFVPAVPTCSATDSPAPPQSGLTGTCVVSGYSAAVGGHSLTGSQSDLAGNTGTSAPRSYTVAAWVIGNSGGFKSPVSSDPSQTNSVKAGSTVPLKFNVFRASNHEEITDVSLLAASWTWAKTACDLGDTEVPVNGEAGSTYLRYEDGQFIRNWKTSTTKGCGTLTLTLADGSTISAAFRLR